MPSYVLTATPNPVKVFAYIFNVFGSPAMDEFSSEYEVSIIRGFSECFFENATLLLSPVIVAVPHSISAKNALLFY